MLSGVLISACVACSSDAAKEKGAPDRTPGVLVAGTRIDATIQGALTSRTNTAGDSTQAITSRNVIDGSGAIAIPAGSTVTLTVAQMEAGTDQVRPDGRLSLVASSLTVDARPYPISAALKEVPHHMEWRDAALVHTVAPKTAYRDVIVSAGTPIVLTLAASLKVSAK